MAQYHLDFPGWRRRPAKNAPSIISSRTPKVHCRPTESASVDSSAHCKIKTRDHCGARIATGRAPDRINPRIPFAYRSRPPLSKSALLDQNQTPTSSPTLPPDAAAWPRQNLCSPQSLARSPALPTIRNSWRAPRSASCRPIPQPPVDPRSHCYWRLRASAPSSDSAHRTSDHGPGKTGSGSYHCFETRSRSAQSHRPCAVPSAPQLVLRSYCLLQHRNSAAPRMWLA
jgi:hypothetical protein